MISKGLRNRKTYVKAVDDITLTINKGEIVGLVGESGSGKTTLARVILWLTKPTDSTVIFNGVDLSKATKKQMKDFRTEVAVVFQDPASNLNPRETVESSIMDFDMTKSQRLDYGESQMTHAMVLQGVNILPDGTPNRWRVENSWGDDVGKKGYFVMLFPLIEAFRRIDEGTLDKHQKYRLRKSDYINYDAAFGAIGCLHEGIDLTVEDLYQLMSFTEMSDA